MEDSTITHLKSQARAESLRMAKHLYGDSNYTSNAIGKAFSPNPNPESIIKQAEKFYEYLVQDLPK